MSRVAFRLFGRVGLLAAAIIVVTAAAQAASLRVTPVTISLPAPNSSSVIRVGNDGAAPIGVQVRIFRWVQQNGEDVLLPTTDVVASPPLATLQPGGENVIRVVRTNGAPVVGEEAYRILVDELPDPLGQNGGTGVNLVLRHSIPVFFVGPGAGAGVLWRVVPGNGGYTVVATNVGTSRLKVVNLSLSDAGGRLVGEQAGLVGYVLGGATMQWFLPGAGLRPGEQAVIGAEGDAGPFNAPVLVQGG